MASTIQNPSVADQLMMTTRPNLLPYLLQLGVIEDRAKDYTVRYAYQVLFRLLAERLQIKRRSNRKPPKRLNYLFQIWTNGVALDALSGYSEEEALKLLEMIWERKKELCAA